MLHTIILHYHMYTLCKKKFSNSLHVLAFYTCISHKDKYWLLTLLIPALHVTAQGEALNLPPVYWDRPVLSHEAGNNVRATCTGTKKVNTQFTVYINIASEILSTAIKKNIKNNGSDTCIDTKYITMQIIVYIATELLYKQLII